MITNKQTKQNRSRKYRWLSALIAVLFIVSACTTQQASSSDTTSGSTQDSVVAETNAESSDSTALEPAPRTDHPAPDFTLTTIDGESVTLSDLKGQPVILNFWASWCGPCRLEMPHLQAAHTTHEDAGLVILGVNLTKRESNVDDVSAFIDEFALTFPVVMDEAGDVASLYEVRGQPASVFIDRNGVIQMVWQGPVNQTFIDEQVEGLLAS